MPLNFSVGEPISWMGYSLGETANVAFSGNTTLNGLASGPHSLVVYANDTVGNMGATENVNFTIEKPESFPVVTVGAVAENAIALVVAGLLVYHKKHK